MLVEISVCTDDGWITHAIETVEQHVSSCLALPKGACRVAFWNEVLGMQLPTSYRAMIWKAT